MPFCFKSPKHKNPDELDLIEELRDKVSCLEFELKSVQQDLVLTQSVTSNLSAVLEEMRTEMNSIKSRESLDKPEIIKPKPAKKRSIPKKIKSLVWDTYIGDNIAKSLCLCCKKTEIKMMDFHCGHYISENNGGDMSIENLRPICSGCNLSMATRNMDEFINDFKL